MKKITALAFGVVAMLASTLATAEQLLDRVVIVVNEQVILESEMKNMLASVRRDIEAGGGRLPSDSALETQVAERLVLQTLQKQIAERMGIRINDAIVDQAIASIASDNGMPVDGLRQQITAQGQSWADYREEIRTQILVSEVQRASIQRRVYMSPQEINLLVDLIKQQGNQDVEYRVGHILISLQDEQGRENEALARERANEVLNRLNEGDDFAQLAITASAASNALEGGDMGFMSLNALPTLFANNIRDKEEGTVVGPLRSGLGFHILKVHEVRGTQRALEDEVKARHILIRPSVILSDNRAQQMLRDFREQIISGEKTFAELARQHSSDTGSAADGGEMGWLPPDVFVPEFRSVVSRIELNTISEPFRTEFGWHIVEVLDRRQQDITEQRLREQAQNILYRRKFQEELDVWFQEIRDNAYVDYRL
ncbi:peptidylprolyl isomerase SurA [Aliidiomarina halalkaliphila]|uniref:Chaperone SurA n=1 Tax=Aliidiomarina halalkaliphila TaxID=2593535 RepID=A0A552WZ98_9GAMM|nr:peptidylprolyl isomerase SurA [Aliidiomarina halalkaliphila]TRW48150.1 peptidylprolyl isomerase SurA [Aliidiomarina halalkaliphila]